MRGYAALALLAVGAAPVDHPRTYLASIVDLPVTRDEGVERFSFATWGVDFKAVCHFPAGWRITADGDATPDGELSGTGSLGATWFGSSPHGTAFDR
jgi:hypothetical protein